MRGFTLIELLVVVIIIGILATVAMPQYIKVVEKGRIADVLSYMGGVRKSQDRYALYHTSYLSDANTLDVSVPMFRYFSNAVTMTGGAPTGGWQITFTRNSTPIASASYGGSAGYQVIFNSLTGNFSSDNGNVISDLLPQ